MDWMEIFLDDDVIMTTLELQCCQLKCHFDSISNLAVPDKKFRAIPLIILLFFFCLANNFRVENPTKLKTYLFFLFVAENPFDVQFAMPLFCYVMEMGKKYFA